MPRSVFWSCFQHPGQHRPELEIKEKQKAEKEAKHRKHFPKCYAVLDLSDCNAQLPQMELQETSTKRSLSTKKYNNKKTLFLPRNSKGVFCLLCLVPPPPARQTPPPNPPSPSLAP